MENDNEIIYPSTGGSFGFAIGFWVIYVAIVFAVLSIFFVIPF